MKCLNCEREFTSEKIYALHTQKCVAVKEQPLEKAKEKETNKPTQRKQRQKRDEA